MKVFTWVLEQRHDSVLPRLEFGRSDDQLLQQWRMIRRFRHPARAEAWVTKVARIAHGIVPFGFDLWGGRMSAHRRWGIAKTTLMSGVRSPRKAAVIMAVATISEGLGAWEGGSKVLSYRQARCALMEFWQKWNDPEAVKHSTRLSLLWDRSRCAQLFGRRRRTIPPAHGLNPELLDRAAPYAGRIKALMRGIRRVKSYDAEYASGVVIRAYANCGERLAGRIVDLIMKNWDSLGEISCNIPIYQLSESTSRTVAEHPDVIEGLKSASFWAGFPE